MKGTKVTHIKVCRMQLSTLTRSSVKPEVVDAESGENSTIHAHLKNVFNSFIPSLNFTTHCEPYAKKNAKSSSNVHRSKKHLKKLEKVNKAKEVNTMDDSNKSEEIEELISVGSVSESSSSNKPLNDNIKQKSFNSDIFDIGDDQLSGEKLAQHFKISDIKSDEGQQNPKSNTSTVKTLINEQSPNVTLDVDRLENTDLEAKTSSPNAHPTDLVQQKNLNELPEQSSTNQSTINDISDLLDEFSDGYSFQHSQSNGISESKEVNVMKEDDTIKNKKIDIEKKDEKSTETERSVPSIESHRSNKILDVPIELENQIRDFSLEDTEETRLNLDYGNESPRCNTDEILLKDEKNSLSSDTSEELHIENLKKNIMSLKKSPKKLSPYLLKDDQTDDQSIIVKQMERVSNEYSKEILEDISEESEKISMADKSAFDSVVSLNMIQSLENKVKDLQDMVSSKDVCLASLNMQLNSVQRRESDSHPPSGRDSCSLLTNSTEYQTLQDNFGHKYIDLHNELMQRDNLIEKLTESLQKSIQIRETVQLDSEKLATEVEELKKRLAEIDEVRKPYFQLDADNQKISQISLNLESDSDENLDQNVVQESFVNDSNSLESITDNVVFNDISNYLNSEESVIFSKLQKKIDKLVNQKLNKIKIKHISDVNELSQGMENQRQEKEVEINRLKQLLCTIRNGSTDLDQLRQELEKIHSKEMEDLRQYFEKKCTDLEKQFSEEVFSQQSQRNEDNSDLSDAENLPDENIPTSKSRECSPRKKSKENVYSALHKQNSPMKEYYPSLTNLNTDEEDLQINCNELKAFYEAKHKELSNNHDKIVKNLTDKLKRFENKNNDMEFMFHNDNNVRKLTQSVNDILQKNQSEMVPSMNTEDADLVNDRLELNKIALEYERRLQEQINMAKEDLIKELERHIQTLLSETNTDDNHWPPELILLREKFTAKSQLEIAQLQIKHEQEMSRLKADYEKQLNRKIKRQSTFDSGRDLNQILNERDSLRELSSSFRYILSELAKYVGIYEHNLNETFLDNFQKLTANIPNTSFEVDGGGDNEPRNVDMSFNCSLENETLQQTLSKIGFSVPNVSNLISVIEDPGLISFITNQNVTDENFNLKECLEKLTAEAQLLLELSKEIHHKESKLDENKIENDNKNMDGEAKIFVGTNTSENEKLQRKHVVSLPTVLKHDETDDSSSHTATNELNSQVNELKNRLVKSENDRNKLQQELEITIKRNCELGIELASLKDQLEQLDSNKESYSEGYALGEIKIPQKLKCAKQTTSFINLQEKARNILNTPTQKISENTTGNLLEMIEAFCREGDRVLEDNKKEHDDLQAQIDAADKQLKSTRQFLEDQAAERELEREEFLKEIEKLKTLLNEKEKRRSSLQNVSNEFNQMENYVRDLKQQVGDRTAQKEKLEYELKASIDKIFDLREIISELETQNEQKAINEHVLSEKLKEMECYISKQNHSNEVLQHELESLNINIEENYVKKITQLEEALKSSRPLAEQNSLLKQFGEQLSDIATTLNQKSKTLEALHRSVASASCSTNTCEDVSVERDKVKNNEESPRSNSLASPRINSLPFEAIQQIFEELARHTRLEEAALKRIRDLEMQIGNIRGAYGELQQEKDNLQERMSEQLVRISNLQTKLDQQRQRTEDIHRSGTSELNIRIHDLQSELQNLTETLSSRDKQIINLKNHLAQSNAVIEKQETEIAIGFQTDKSVVEKLENDLKLKTDELKKLREKMKFEMINKLALPDLMETMLADKNEEIDVLKEQLELRNKEIQSIMQINLTQDKNVNVNIDEGVTEKLSARTLSDIVSISEYDEPDVIRRAAQEKESLLLLPDNEIDHLDTIESSKQANANLTENRTDEIQLFQTLQTQPTFDRPNFFSTGNLSNIPKNKSSVDSFHPRQINFSEFADDSPIKESTYLLNDDKKRFEYQLEQAEKEINDLKEKIANLESEKNKENQKLSIDLQKNIELNSELRAQKQLLNADISDLSSKIRKNENIEETMKKTEIEVSENQLKISHLEDEVSSKNNEISNLHAELLKLGVHNEALVEKVSQLNSLEGELISLRKIIEEKENAIAVLRKTLEDLQLESNLKLKNLEFTLLESSEKLTLYSSNLDSANKKIEILNKQVSEYNSEINKLTSLESTNKELLSLRSALAEKTFAYEKCQLDFESLQKEVKALEDDLAVKKKFIEKLQAEEPNFRIQQSKTDAQRNETSKNVEKSQNSESSKLYSLDEIAHQVEKELNYSAQLDDNILKAIESEEENNFNLNIKTDEKFTRELHMQLRSLVVQLNLEKLNSNELAQELQKERLRCQDIQQQDVAIIEALQGRLEEAMKKEGELYKQIDLEREKINRLSNQISIFQRSESKKTALLLTSPPSSPRKSPRSLEFDSDVKERLKREIKLLNSKNEHEKERYLDLEKVLEKEKSRFNTELQDRIEFTEKLKREMDQLAHEKDISDQQLEDLQERIVLQSEEIISLEKRIATLQETEARRAERWDKHKFNSTQNNNELEQLKSKIVHLQQQNDHLNHTISALHGDIERSVKRETKLAETLLNSETSIPQQFLQKMKEMKSILMENSKDNNQMTETVRTLVEERKTLQRKIKDLEAQINVEPNSNELEERTNHLLGRYLRVESHRKALVHQKRYLLIALQSYQDTEAKALALIHTHENASAKPRKKLFKCAALVIIAIQRMKFVVNRWHTGKRIISSKVYTITQSKRNPSWTNFGAQSASSNGQQQPPISLSPPCRDAPALSTQQKQSDPSHSPVLNSNLQITTPTTTTFGQIQDNNKEHKIDWILYKKR